jgi:hypothetical protein
MTNSRQTRDVGKSSRSDPDKRSNRLKGGEFKRAADEVNERPPSGPSLRDTDWADLPPKTREKRQRG